MLGVFENDPNELLRKATSQRNSGNIEDAITTLQRAYKLIQSGQIIYPVETFLRLPAYLHEAGRREEAWQEYQQLLSEGCPNQLMPDVIPMDQSIVYDKMRLFLQRDGLHDHAVAYGVLSYCSWAIGLYLQKRKDELQNHISQIEIDKLTHRLLKKANRLNTQEKISEIVFEKLNNVGSINLNELFADINSCLLV